MSQRSAPSAAIPAAERDPNVGTLAPRTLLVHVPFHFVPRRWEYLRDALGALSTYRLASVTVVVDTNSPEAEALIRTIPTDARFSVRVDVHRELAHPFELTWAGRRHMAEAAGSFDYFMYIEDDIRVPWEAFASWAADEPLLGARDFVRGFLRVENDERGRIVATDWREPMRRPVVVELEGRRFLRPDSFYQACWLASQARMRRFAAEDSWTTGFHRWSSVRRGHRWNRGANYRREYSAFGWSCSRPGRPRVLLPVEADGTISRSAWVWHLPNNYGLDPRQPGGRLAAEDLVVGGTIPAGSAAGRVAAIGAVLSEAWTWFVFLLGLDAAWRAADGAVRRTARRVRSAFGGAAREGDVPRSEGG